MMSLKCPAWALRFKSLPWTISSAAVWREHVMLLQLLSFCVPPGHNDKHSVSLPSLLGLGVLTIYQHVMVNVHPEGHDLMNIGLPLATYPAVFHLCFSS